MTRPLDTNAFFSGGAGMFIQYHDVVKPVYFYAVLKLIRTNITHGLPLHLIKDLSIFSLIEWYLNRRYTNPLISLDPSSKLDHSSLHSLLNHILANDPSIYTVTPLLNIQHMLAVYRQQSLSFPIYIYSEEYDSNISKDIPSLFPGIKTTYCHGNIDKAIQQCDQNFTYIISDIELLPTMARILLGTCSHILIAKDYRYNYKDNRKTLKYNLKDISNEYPFIRTGITSVLDRNRLALAFLDSIQGRK